MTNPSSSPWADALKSWATANPWAAATAISACAGFTALALWLMFNAVFG